jgi:hypothetical protein
VPEETTALDWGSAAVEDGRLTVPVTGEPPRGWSGRVKHVMERLEGHGRHRWGAVKVTRKAVTVDDVGPGMESDLHHFLESVVLQVNADLGADEDGDDERSAEDERMTEAFRAFSADED